MKRLADFGRRVSARYGRTARGSGHRRVPLSIRRRAFVRVTLTRHVDRRAWLTTWTLRPELTVHPAYRLVAAPAGRDRAPSSGDLGPRLAVHHHSSTMIVRSRRSGPSRAPGLRPAAAPRRRPTALVLSPRSAGRWSEEAIGRRAGRTSSAAAPPVATSVRRSGPGLREPVPEPPQGEPGHGQGWELPGQPWPAPARTGEPVAPPTQVDVERLTDRVVAAIDQRLIAHRERSGRSWT